MVYDRDKIGWATSFSFGTLAEKKVLPEWNPKWKSLQQEMVKREDGKRVGIGEQMGNKHRGANWGSGCTSTLACQAGKQRKYDFGVWTSQTFKTSQEKSFGGSETVQSPATTECFIAVWKCLFSEHKFRGQIQGMSRNKAYHHVSWADKDNLLYPAFVLGQSEESGRLTFWNPCCSVLIVPSLNFGMAWINPLGDSSAEV